MATGPYELCGIGNAIVDVIARADDAFLNAHDIAKGRMSLIDAPRAAELYALMTPEVEMSGGSAANTISGFVALGGKAAYMGKVATDTLGETFARDLRSLGVDYATPPRTGGEGTARCMIFVTPDAQRSMNTYLGASSLFASIDIDQDVVRGSQVTYLEGFLFDRTEAQAAFRDAAACVHAAERKLALTLSDVFCVERHRDAFRALVQKEVDILFANEAELTALYQTNSLDEALAAVQSECVLSVTTRSGDGAVIVTPQQIVTVPSMPDATLVDTTGAGDLFAAGFLFGLIRKKDFATCGRIGHAVAAEAISHFGPRPQGDLKTLVKSLL